MDFPSHNFDDSYMQNYQLYLKQKEASTTYQNANSSTPSIGTKSSQNYLESSECKVCSVLSKPGDLAIILNQGLFHKYTSSQDFFYSKDITALIEKKRTQFCINYEDDLVMDEEQEHLKQFFPKKDSKSLMLEIQQFYSQFYNFPRNFHKSFFKLISANIVRHRRLEYIKVFQNTSINEESNEKNEINKEDGFNILPLLGETFLRDNYKEYSELKTREVTDRRVTHRRETEQYLIDVENNFKQLKNHNNITGKNQEEKLSEALYNKKYMLYTRNDSETAEEMLRNIVQNFKSLEKNTKKAPTPSLKVKAMSNNDLLSGKKIPRIDSPTKELKSKKLLVHSRTQSPTKFQYIQTNSLKELERSSSRNELEYLTERLLVKGVKEDIRREPWNENSGRIILKQDNFGSIGNLSPTERKTKPVTLSKKSLKLPTPLGKFNLENLKEVLLDRESILNRVSQLRTTKNIPIGLKGEEAKLNIPNTSKNHPMTLYNEGSSTRAKPKVTYFYNPNTFQSPSSLENLVLRKYEEKQKSPVLGPNVVNRDLRSGLKKREVPVPIVFNSTTRNIDSKIFDLDSPGKRNIIRATKSNSKIIPGLKTPSILEIRADNDWGNERNGISPNYSISHQAQKILSNERKQSPDLPLSTERKMHSTKHSRSMSTGIHKPRLEVSPSKKRVSGHKKSNKSISGLQNILDLSQGINAVLDSRLLGKNREIEQKIDIYSQGQARLSKRKSKSNANLNAIYFPVSISRGDISGKETKKGGLALDMEGIGISSGKVAPIKEEVGIVDFWSPKITKNLLNKDKIQVKVQTTKSSKHLRYASRG